MFRQLKEILNRSLLAQVCLFMILYWIVHSLCMAVFFQGFLGTFERWSPGNTAGWLTSDPFHSWSIIFRSLLNPFFFIALAVLYIPFFVYRRSIPVLEKPERIFLFACAFILTWELITYDYNYYLGSAFWFDRIFLLLLCVGLIRFPVLIPLFIASAFVYRAQFNFPVQGFPLFDKRILFDLLIMYCVYQYMRMVVREFSLRYLYLALIIVASNYFFSGFEKLVTTPHGYEWLTENDSADLFNNAVIRGWLACSGGDTIDMLRAVIMEFGPAFQWAVLVLELGVLLIFWKRRIAIWWLTGLFLMHLGIFIFGSMLFWKWMLADLALVVVLVYQKNYFDGLFTSRNRFWLTIPLVLMSSLWLKPTSIAWHDTPYTQYFSYEVQDEAGNWYVMNKNEMNPYHQWFQYDHFLFLVNDTLPGVTGLGYTNDFELAEVLRDPSADYERILQEKGKVHFDSTMKLGYEGFIRTYFRNRNEFVGKKMFVRWLAPPHHLHTSVCGEKYDGNFRVKKFRVTLNRETSVGSRHFPMERIPAAEIAIYE